MATKHQLYLDIRDTINPEILCISDVSIYASALEIKCPRLEIVTPGSDFSWNIEPVSTPFHYILNACTLGLSSDCSHCSPTLPDGLYKIKYSVSPNDKVWVEYHHLRTTVIMNGYDRLLSQIGLTSSTPSPDAKQRLESLRLIKSYVDVARTEIESEGNIKKGLDLFTYAGSLLSAQTKLCKSC